MFSPVQRLKCEMPHSSLESFTRKVSLEPIHTGITYCQVFIWKTELFLRQAILFFFHILAAQSRQVRVLLYIVQTQKWQSFLSKSIKVKYHLLQYSVRIHLQLISLFQCESPINLMSWFISLDVFQHNGQCVWTHKAMNDGIIMYLLGI